MIFGWGVNMERENAFELFLPIGILTEGYPPYRTADGKIGVNPVLVKILELLGVDADIGELERFFIKDVPPGEGDIYVYHGTNAQIAAFDLYRDDCDQLDMVLFGVCCTAEHRDSLQALFCELNQQVLNKYPKWTPWYGNCQKLRFMLPVIAGEATYTFEKGAYTQKIIHC